MSSVMNSTKVTSFGHNSANYGYMFDTIPEHVGNVKLERGFSSSS
jgi:hypothetical protein